MADTGEGILIGAEGGTAAEPGGGTVIGGVTGGIVGGCIGIACAIVADGIATSVPDNRNDEEPLENVYRVFGGLFAKQDGWSWTPIDPRTVPDYANQAGLPSEIENTQEYLVQGQVRPSDIVERRPARPIPPNRGGLLEYVINPANVRNQVVSPFKPQ